MCRVIKKNEKASDYYHVGEHKGKKGITGSTSNEPLSISGTDVSSQASHLYNESGYSSPTTTTSPYNVVPTSEEFDQASLQIDPSTIWISPEFILDSSKVFPFYTVQMISLISL